MRSTFSGRSSALPEMTRDVMPDCVIRVGRIILFKHPFDGIPNLQEIRRRYPSEDGLYRDYISTFDASMDIDVMDVMEEEDDN